MQEEGAETSHKVATARKLVDMVLLIDCYAEGVRRDSIERGNCPQTFWRFHWLIVLQEEGTETSQNAATGHKLVDRPWFDLTRVWKDQTKVIKF